MKFTKNMKGFTKSSTATAKINKILTEFCYWVALYSSHFWFVSILCYTICH